MIMFVGTQGLLDEYPVECIRKLEKEFLAYMQQNKPDVGAEIMKAKELTEETKQKIKTAFEAFKTVFKP